jgi:enoyl-CoA hydratase/carnithine racemase
MGNVLVDHDESVAVVSLNRPEKLNAIDSSINRELGAAFASLAADRNTTVVVVRGLGRAFSAGADLGGSNSKPTAEDVLEGFELTKARQLATWEMPKPVIAAVDGYCLGRGMELALWCDIVIASQNAKFGTPEVRDGSFVASLLPWIVGPQKAKLLLWLGDTIDAQVAYELGFVNSVVPDSAFSSAMELARKLSNVPSATLRAVKTFVNAAVDGLAPRQAQSLGAYLNSTLRGTSAEELGISELIKLRERDGLKAYITARDAPFA